MQRLLLIRKETTQLKNEPRTLAKDSSPKKMYRGQIKDGPWNIVSGKCKLKQ
jgi:hypothetical protein